MTEAAAAVDLNVSGAEAPPTMTREQAWSRRAQMMSDPNFVARYKEGGSASKEGKEMAEVHRVISHFDLISGRGVNPAMFGEGHAKDMAAREAVQREEI